MSKAHTTGGRSDYIYIYIYRSPPPLPSYSASYNITANHHYHHRHHLNHHSTSYNACIQYMRHCFRKKTDHQCKLLWAWSSTSTLQTTTCAKEYLCTVVKNKDHQRNYRGSKTTPPPLASTMQQAHVSLHKGICH